MSDRLLRVEQVLRRELASVILEGELRDPRLSPSAAISITGVKVSGDLSSARVYVDVLTSEVSIDKVLAALNAGKAAARARLSRRIRMKHVPSLSFERDKSIEQGVAIERVLYELAQARLPTEPDAEPEPDSEPADDPGQDGS